MSSNLILHGEEMNEVQYELDDLLADIIGYTKATYEKLRDAGVDVLGLYNFYYYTAKRQKTNQVKASVGYCAKGIGISEDRVRKARKKLIEMGLIEDLKKKGESGEVEGWYVRVKYISSTLANIQSVEVPECGNPDPNAGSNNNEMLEVLNNEMLTRDFLEFYSLYPRKESKLKAEASYKKSREGNTKKKLSPVPHDVIMAGLRKYITHISVAGTKPEFIKQPATRLNQGCWDDEYKIQLKKSTPAPLPEPIIEMSLEDRKRNLRKLQELKDAVFSK